jgi:hypothetical protein
MPAKKPLTTNTAAGLKDETPSAYEDVARNIVELGRRAQRSAWPPMDASCRCATPVEGNRSYPLG